MSRQSRAAGLFLVAVAVAGLSGCPSSGGKPAKGVRGVAISVAGLGPAGLLEAVDAQRGEWEQSRGARADLRREPAADLKGLAGADVILFPGDRMGDLVDAGLLATLPDSLVKPPPPAKGEDGSKAPPPPDPLAFADVVPPYQDLASKYGKDRLALPLGGSALVLVYRRDVFEGEANRKAAESAGVALGPPETWEDLDALAKFFHGRDWDGDGQPEAGIALAWGDDPEGVGDDVFLARSAAFGLHRDQFGFLFDSDELGPRIDTPPFVEALRGLASLKGLGPPKAASFDAEAARAAFRAGEAALLIDRAERSGRWNDPKKPMSLGIAPLPGSKRVYDPERKAWETPAAGRASYLPFGGGWMVGLSSSSTGDRREAALDFLTYLAGPETSSRLLADRAFPMLPVRAAQVAAGPIDARSAAGLDPRAWSEAISRTWLAPRVAIGLRIPSADAYLADLAKARRAAVGGESAEAALGEAARSWAARSEKLGRERQLWHYRRSLNRLSTPARPPAR